MSQQAALRRKLQRAVQGQFVCANRTGLCHGFVCFVSLGIISIYDRGGNGEGEGGEEGGNWELTPQALKFLPCLQSEHKKLELRVSNNDTKIVWYFAAADRAEKTTITRALSKILHFTSNLEEITRNDACLSDLLAWPVDLVIDCLSEPINVSFMIHQDPPIERRVSVMTKSQ
ncbi:hypothetical protein RRG08_045808 [Elysia crispata]|uniref:Uncharacterized protein n=1 Tax=Elysia crispata TaxID=231223 RepID=A0AAE1D7S4_9GAST|nr:hypothetical protein RRG08_045808 [Elysia crispata]